MQNLKNNEKPFYNKFKKEQLDKKIQREKEAWNLVQNNKGIYNKELLNKIFDKVDYFEPNKNRQSQGTDDAKNRSNHITNDFSRIFDAA